MTEPQVQFRSSQVQVCILRLKFPEGHEYAALGREFGLPWPVVPNTVANGDGVKVLWLGPSEWVVEEMPTTDVVARAARACGTTLHHVADVSEGRVVFEITGPKTRELLAKGCSLDLHPRMFAPGQCAQTLLQHANVMLESLDGGAVRFYTDRSIAQWVTAWLEDAALEYRGS